MKKLLFVLSLTSALFSCKKETTTPNTNTNTNTTDTTKTSTNGIPGPSVTDIDGNTYKTVTIGKQTWMAENLKTSKYSDGTEIPNITDNTQWSNLTTGAWAYYNNDAANNAKYGKLYNWYAVSPTTNGNKNVCPTGWHVPTDAEWTVLTDFLGGESVAGGKMKEVGNTSWHDPFIGPGATNSSFVPATNSSLFSALPGGYRSEDGSYGGLNDTGNWWSTTLYSNDFYSIRTLSFLHDQASSSGMSKTYGLSVRCLRD